MPSCSDATQACGALCSSAPPKPEDQKVARLALAILVFCAVAVTSCSLMLHYPTASSAFITTFAVGGVAAFIAFCVAFVRLGQSESRAASTGSANPFDEDNDDNSTGDA